jgi:hypothetical protein
MPRTQESYAKPRTPRLTSDGIKRCQLGANEPDREAQIQYCTRCGDQIIWYVLLPLMTTQKRQQWQRKQRMPGGDPVAEKRKLTPRTCCTCKWDKWAKGRGIPRHVRDAVRTIELHRRTAG